jgi:hypothetical protein
MSEEGGTERGREGGREWGGIYRLRERDGELEIQREHGRE